MPKPPCFGSRLYPPSGCWQEWKGADKTQRDIRGLLREMTMCWDGHCHCSWSLETFFNMHFSDPGAAPRFCVFFLLMAPVDEPVNRLSLKECFPVTCFGLCFLSQTQVHQVGDAIKPSHPLSTSSPPTFNLSQCQGLFQGLGSLYQVAKVLEFPLQHHSFQ